MVISQQSGPRATAYVHNGRLCVVGIEETDLGPVPFAVSAQVFGEISDGPVDFGSELPESLEEAVERVQVPIEDAVQDGHLKLAVEHLCLRARNGDQNAMALLGGIREAAQNGVPRAQKSLEAAERFLKANPPKQRAAFGLELPEFPRVDTSILKAAEHPIAKAHAAVALCRNMGPHRMACVLADSADGLRAVCEHAKRLVDPAVLWQGYRHSRFLTALEQARAMLDPETFSVFQLGFALGRSAAILEAKQGNLKPVLTPAIAWELGL